MTDIKGHRDLEVWKAGMELVKLAYTMTVEFPNEERFDRVSQRHRAAVSVPSNIAEGAGGARELQRFLRLIGGLQQS